MQPYLLSPKERVRHWREFRLSFTKKELDLEQIAKTMKYWQPYPTFGRWIDVDFPKTWPTPWELIMDGNICEFGITYLMEQTLLMSDDRWNKNRLQLMFVDDKDISEMKLVLVVDDKYVANFEYDNIIDFDIIQNTCIIQHKYRALARHKHKIINN